MYTKKEISVASKIIKQIAREHQVPEEQVRLDMEESMNAGRRSLDPVVQARWATFRFSGEKPTVEEFILWAASMAQIRL